MIKKLNSLHVALKTQFPDIYLEENSIKQKEEMKNDIMNDIMNDINTKILENNVKSIIKSKSKIYHKKRKAPSTHAKSFEVGYKMVSDNCEDTYEVMITKNNVKRWRKVTKIL